MVFFFCYAAEHGVVVEYFNGIRGLEVGKLTGNSKYPSKPDEIMKMPTFETKKDYGDFYGAKLQSYFLVSRKQKVNGLNLGVSIVVCEK